MPNVVLHQWEISPFCGRVRRILATKGVAFTIENYNGLKARGAAKLTPTGKLKAQGIGRLTRDEVERRFREHLDRLVLLLDGKNFLVADAISIADIAVASQLSEVMRTHPIGREIEGRPQLRAWLDRIPS